MRNLVILFLFGFCLVGYVFADAKSDYDYQYTKYRDSYLEFSVYKKDYLSTPSLDNQQKVLLSLKQSLVSRDLAKASLARHLINLINIDKVIYQPVVPIIQLLDEAAKYFSARANEAQSVVTLENLKSFDDNYISTSKDPEKTLKLGIIAHKITKLVHLQNLSYNAFESLKYKIPESASVRVKERLVELDKDMATINAKIDEMAQYLVSPEGQEEIDSRVFFSSRTELFSEIRQLQLSWIDRLIDLDLNYAKI